MLGASINSGEAVDAYGIGKVMVLGNPEYGKDEVVMGLISWGEYSVIKPGGMLRKLDPMDFPLSNHVSFLD
ncbi:hypothetical protein M5689_011273 [Euphorbia peplus]|nr:hypothetical protein M5689_011273 [Euphorbia peplus]